MVADRAEDPGIHAEHLVGVLNRQRVMGDTQHCATFLGELVEQFEQLCGVFTIERAARLVSEQHSSGARGGSGGVCEPHRGDPHVPRRERCPHPGQPAGIEKPQVQSSSSMTTGPAASG